MRYGFFRACHTVVREGLPRLLQRATPNGEQVIWAASDSLTPQATPANHSHPTPAPSQKSR